MVLDLIRTKHGTELLDIANRECFALGIPRQLAMLSIAKRLFSSLLAGTEVFRLRSSSIERQRGECRPVVTTIAEGLQGQNAGSADSYHQMHVKGS
jgi:hypothetical protein